MTTTREDRERAAAHHYGLLVPDDTVLLEWVATGVGLVGNPLTYPVIQTAELLAAHREAAVAGERERIAKMAEATVEKISAQPYDFRESAADGAAASALRAFAAKIRSGK